MFEALFPSSQASPDTAVQCIINTIVPDDTNTRLKGPGRGDRSLVHTVMNVVQSCVVYYEKPLSDGHNWHCFSLPCPVSILKVANTEHIHAAYASYLIAGAAGLGQRWKALGISSSVTDAIANGKWIVQLMCGDALEANSSMDRSADVWRCFRSQQFCFPIGEAAIGCQARAFIRQWVAHSCHSI